jgi:hypothetical protein
MFKGIAVHWRPLARLVVLLAIASGSIQIALAAQADRQAAPSGLPAPGTPASAMAAAGGPSNPYFSVETITLGDGAQLERMTISGPPKPPPGYELERAPVAPSVLNQPMATKTLPVPAYTWVFGCSAVSASMIGGYWDRNGFPGIYTGPTNGGVMPMDNSSWPTWTDSSGDSYPGNPLTASRNGSDGRATRGSIDDYWVEYGSTAADPYVSGGWTQHVWGDAVGDYMKTSQSACSNTDGSTAFYNYTSSATPLTCADMVTYGIEEKDGTYGRKLFYEARGYPVTECYSQKTDNTVTGGFSFAQYKAKIDAGRPVFLNLEGHSIVGIGYQDPSTVFLNDTWDYSTHQMTWGGSYSGMQLLSVSIADPDIPAVTCYPLTLGHTGNGTDPAASPSKSTGCASGQYVAGESIALSGATPDAGWGIAGWTGTADDASTASTNSLTMPASARSAGVNYLRLLGGVNGDGLVNSTDALIILSADAGLDTSQFCPMNCGDVNADGQINSTDALILLSYDAGMTVPFALGQPGCPASATPPPGCTP